MSSGYEFNTHTRTQELLAARAVVTRIVYRFRKRKARRELASAEKRAAQLQAEGEARSQAWATNPIGSTQPVASTPADERAEQPLPYGAPPGSPMPGSNARPADRGERMVMLGDGPIRVEVEGVRAETESHPQVQS